MPGDVKESETLAKSYRFNKCDTFLENQDGNPEQISSRHMLAKNMSHLTQIQTLAILIFLIKIRLKYVINLRIYKKNTSYKTNSRVKQIESIQ